MNIPIKPSTLSGAGVAGGPQSFRIGMEGSASGLLRSRPGSLQQLVADQVARTPESCAISVGGTRLSYREIDEAANRLARALTLLTVAPRSVIAVALDRSPELVVALLGVLKSGSAYVLLDPRSSPERLAQKIDSAQPLVILSRSGLAGVFEGCDIPTLMVDADALPIAGMSGAPFPQVTLPDDVAYVSYTFGMAGTPVPHRDAVTLLDGMRGTQATVRTSLASTVAFDLPEMEFFLALSEGVTLSFMLDDAAKTLGC